jgi:hypothetical protein
MPNAEPLATWVEGGQMCLAVRVVEDGRHTEYIGRVPIDAEFMTATNGERRALLVAAVKAVRSAQRNPPATPPTPVSGVFQV